MFRIVWVGTVWYLKGFYLKIVIGTLNFPLSHYCAHTQSSLSAEKESGGFFKIWNKTFRAIEFHLGYLKQSLLFSFVVSFIGYKALHSINVTNNTLV